MIQHIAISNQGRYPQGRDSQAPDGTNCIRTRGEVRGCTGAFNVSFGRLSLAIPESGIARNQQSLASRIDEAP
jgi:hypothetical protein